MLLCHSVAPAFSASVWLPSSPLASVEVRWSGKSAAAGCGEKGSVTDDVLGWKVNVFFDAKVQAGQLKRKEALYPIAHPGHRWFHLHSYFVLIIGKPSLLVLPCFEQATYHEARWRGLVPSTLYTPLTLV